ncbi:MAG: metalloregulator ArsR/SmtB family transcription factor [Proteobacteria bacterium]|jgi:ArsR family transcriptional regulator, arsenate/arsenite/antimonite-responsive transcriptional repressor|nr:metalloregulator ArsR/SmtB family transcription factor [Pseudomonadota bacterium]
MRDLAQLYKAFSDETRIKIVVLLHRHGEHCVCDFEGVLGLSQSASSRHLRRLYQAKVTDHRRQGSWVYYRLRDELEPAQLSLVQIALDNAPSEQAEALERAHAAWMERKRQIDTCLS